MRNNMNYLPGFVQSITIPLQRTSCVSKRLRVAKFPQSPIPESHPTTFAPARRTTISANSLEESKRRSKSPYDNIPDLNQQYISELSFVERKFGRQRMKKDIVKEAQKSILRQEGVILRPRNASNSKPDAASDRDVASAEVDLSQYKSIRNELLSNTVFVGALGFCLAWGLGTVKDVQSFGLGLLGSFAYVYLLSRSVDRMAEAARETGGPAADALQPARIAILLILVIASAKNSDKLSVLPVLFGFFTYKMATLLPLLTGEAFE